MHLTTYHDQHFLYVRKNRGLPTTYGKQKSLLDYLLQNDFTTANTTHTNMLMTCIQLFGKEKECGLLNRLDNETAGLLYFARTTTVYETYKQLQDTHHVHKAYIADIPGRFPHNTLSINTPIAHHKYIPERMVAIRTEKDLSKTRRQQHLCTSTISMLYYDPQTDRSTVQVTITKGIRHQIRVHLASIGYPIVGDTLYNNSPQTDILHLWSIGIQTQYDLIAQTG